MINIYIFILIDVDNIEIYLYSKSNWEKFDELWDFGNKPKYLVEEIAYIKKFYSLKDAYEYINMNQLNIVLESYSSN